MHGWPSLLRTYMSSHLRRLQQSIVRHLKLVRSAQLYLEFNIMLLKTDSVDEPLMLNFEEQLDIKITSFLRTRNYIKEAMRQLYGQVLS